MWMLSRELGLRSTEVLLGLQVFQDRQGRQRQVQQGQVQQVQRGQVQQERQGPQERQVKQEQHRQVLQVHQGHCSISVKNSKCSKDNEIGCGKDR